MCVAGDSLTLTASVKDWAAKGERVKERIGDLYKLFQSTSDQNVTTSGSNLGELSMDQV